MNDQVTINFLGKNHTQQSLSKMEIGELLKLRNLVAENLGVTRIKSFKDHAQAVDATWKALEKFEAAAAEEEAGAKPKTKAKKEKEPKAPLPPAKCGFAQAVKRPTRAMFRKLTKIAEHPGKGFRVRRWDNYKDGMTLLECAEGEDMTPLDVGYYVDNQLMSLTEPTEEEYQAGLAAWYKKHGLENPAEAKAKKEAERAEAKILREKEKREREEERAKVKAEKEAKKAAADKAKAEAKAKKEAEAKAKKEAADKAKAAKANAA